MGSSMHPAASGGFAAAADHYRRSRPGYARAAVGLLEESIPPGRVLDLAAGTGIMTGQLRRAGREVVAVEPLGEMIAQLRLSLPDVPCARGSAESIPLRGRTLAGVTVAQAFHWFDTDAALREIGRVLVPDGVLALVWNVRDETVAWVRHLTDLVHERSGGRPYGDHREHDWEEVVDRSELFDDLGEHNFDNPVPSTRASVVERVRSTSFVAVMAPEHRESLVVEVIRLLDDAPELQGLDRFDYPHHTAVHLFRRVR